MTEASLALGLRSTAQSLAVIGRALGLFAEEGIDVRVVREETAAPEGLRGLLAGEFMFAELGAVPVVQARLDGHDLRILLAAEPVSALYLVGRPGIDRPDRLEGARIGVLSVSGQTGHSASTLLAQWSRRPVSLVALGTYPAIYRALADGQIEAGTLTADYRLVGEAEHGLHVLADFGEIFGFQGPVLATSGTLCDTSPDFVGAMVRGYVRALRAFRACTDDVTRLLHAHLGFPTLQQARAIHRFYAARFRMPPMASEEGLARVGASLAPDNPAAAADAARRALDRRFVDAACAELG